MAHHLDPGDLDQLVGSVVDKLGPVRDGGPTTPVGRFGEAAVFICGYFDAIRGSVQLGEGYGPEVQVRPQRRRGRTPKEGKVKPHRPFAFGPRGSMVSGRQTAYTETGLLSFRIPSPGRRARRCLSHAVFVSKASSGRAKDESKDWRGRELRDCCLDGVASLEAPTTAGVDGRAKSWSKPAQAPTGVLASSELSGDLTLPTAFWKLRPDAGA